tara:strand:+ start:2380 stop:2619 length:240 start_codon:yes stop_codon:yes gene_type:complete
VNENEKSGDVGDGVIGEAAVEVEELDIGGLVDRIEILEQRQKDAFKIFDFIYNFLQSNRFIKSARKMQKLLGESGDYSE